MKTNFLKILFVLVIATGLTAPSAWSDTNHCTVLVKGTEDVQSEESYLEPLALGDGATMPRFIGERFVDNPVSESTVFTVTNPERFFRLQFGGDGSCLTILASR